MKTEEGRKRAQGVCELLWMKTILDDLKIKYEGIVTVWDVTTRKVNVEFKWSVCSCISSLGILIH